MTLNLHINSYSKLPSVVGLVTSSSADERLTCSREHGSSYSSSHDSVYFLSLSHHVSMYAAANCFLTVPMLQRKGSPQVEGTLLLLMKLRKCFHFLFYFGNYWLPNEQEKQTTKTGLETGNWLVLKALTSASVNIRDYKTFPREI